MASNPVVSIIGKQKDYDPATGASPFFWMVELADGNRCWVPFAVIKLTSNIWSKFNSDVRLGLRPASVPTHAAPSVATSPQPSRAPLCAPAECDGFTLGQWALTRPIAFSEASARLLCRVRVPLPRVLSANVGVFFQAFLPADELEDTLRFSSLLQVTGFDA